MIEQRREVARGLFSSDLKARWESGDGGNVVSGAPKGEVKDCSAVAVSMI